MANEVATTQARPEIVKFREQLEQRAGEIKMALPQHITPEKFQRTIITACQSDPDLLKADRQSLVLACMKAAQDGLLPDKREAAIVVFKENKKTESGWQTRLMCVYLPMVYGLRKKILQSGEVSALEVNVVYAAEVEAGKFIYEVGLEPPLRHRPMLELSLEQTTDDQIVAAYSIATMKDGTRSFELMRRFEIDRVRETSKTGATRDRQGKPRQPSGPWVDWFPEMAKKTVMRRHAKTLPQSGDIIVDVEGQEQEVGRSTAALLGSTDADAPQIEHDPVTGEIHDDEGGEGAQDNQNAADGASDSNEQEEPGKPKRTRRTRAQIDADNAAAEAARQPDRRTEQERHQEVVDETQREQEEREHNGGMTLAESAAAGEEPETDEQTGITKHPAEAKAEQLTDAFDKAETIIDLDRLFNDSGNDREAMPDEIAAEVSASWRRNRERLRGGR
jgi:recombination protein RecT